MKFLLTPGQGHDITQAAPLLQGIAAARLKQCRLIATRYDNTARNFLHLAASMILLA